MAPPLVWEKDDGADRAGPYAIRLEAPNQWRLDDGDGTVGILPTNTAARNAAAKLHRNQGARRRLWRHLVVGAVSLVVLLLAASQRIEPNPDYPPARAQADRLDAARLAVEADEVSIGQVGSIYEGLAGGSFEVLGQSRLGLAGVFEGDCYGLTWRPELEPSGFAVRSNYVTCEPDASIINQPDPPGLTAEMMWPTWEDVLPDEDRSPVWFLPVFILTFGLAFGAFTRVTTLLLTFRR